ncbi:glycosyltransferase family 4 protein [Caloranaerobacter ferrireducens]|uniref:glycosyltransferase family 4 protein n=1 Tax=Caloranaerobacter ferrireducens TaxID=1323370 RepID=UPI00084D75BD|nr:glycosyltransferase family 4 protein [Caloranaerobacter ferrireducens]
MNILIITQHYPPEIGAASNRMKNLSYFLNKLGHKVTVLTSEPTYPNKEIYKKKDHNELKGLENIKVYRVNTFLESYSRNKVKRLILYISFIFSGIYKLLKIKEKFDLIIITSPPIFVGILGIIAKLRYKCKLYLDIRDLWPDSVKALEIFQNKTLLNIAYRFEKFLYNKSDKLIINSTAFKEMLLKKGQTESDIIYLPNGIANEFINRISYIEKDDNFVRVIYAGNLGYAQGLEALIETAKLLKDYKKIKISVIGGGVELEKLISLSKKYDLKNIEFLGVLPREKVVEELLKSHIGIIHLSNRKIFETVIPSKVFDYMVTKLPIVAGVRGEIARLLLESGCALICDPYDSKKMSEYILQLALDKDLREKKGENGYTYLLKHFVWDKNIKELDFKIKNISNKEGMELK